MNDPLNPKRTKSVPLEVTMMKRIGELNKENAHLKAEVERLTAFTTRTIIPNEELQAEVKRLQVEVAEWQESYHLVNERMAQILKQGRGL